MGALFGVPGSAATMVDSCLPFVEANPVVLTVTATSLVICWQLPLSYVASVTTADTSLYGVVDVTFTDGSRLRIAAPAHDQETFAAAITGRTG